MQCPAQEGTALLDDNSGGSVHNGLVDEAEHRLVEGDDSARRPSHHHRTTTTTFDRAVADAPAPFDVVKMDCEGGEYALVYASSPRNWQSVHLRRDGDITRSRVSRRTKLP